MEAPENRKRVLAACCGAHGVQDGLSAALYVLMPILAQTFGLSYAQVGIIRAANHCAATVFELPSGILAERFGERILLVFGLVCAGAGYLCLSSSTGIWTILISLLIVGTGGAFQHALSSSLVSNSFDAYKRRSALGFYNASGDVGKLAYTGLFGLATGFGVAWQGVAVFFAATAFILALAVFHALRHNEIRVPGTDGWKSGSDDKPGGWGIQDLRGFWALCVTVCLDTAVQAGFLVFVVFVVADMGVPTNIATFAVVLTLAGGIFGKAGCGFLAQKIGTRNSFVFVQCMTALGIVVLLLSTPATAFILLPVLGMFLQGSTTITYGSIADLVSGNRQARGFALIYAVSGLSAIGAPVLFGLLSDQSGLDTAMLAMALISLLAIPPSLFLRIWTGRQGAV